MGEEKSRITRWAASGDVHGTQIKFDGFQATRVYKDSFGQFSHVKHPSPEVDGLRELRTYLGSWGKARARNTGVDQARYGTPACV